MYEEGGHSDVQPMDSKLHVPLQNLV